MIDIKKLREQPEVFKKSSLAKNANVDIDEILRLDSENKKNLSSINELRAKLNSHSKTKPAQEEIEKLKKLSLEIKQKVVAQASLQKKLNDLVCTIPNPPTQDTPIGKNERENIIIKENGEKPKFDFKPQEHWELGENLQIIDNERAAKVSGSRFTYLRGELALVQFALIQHTLNTVTDEKIIKKIIKKEKLNIPSKPFTPILPPVLIKPETMRKMARLEPKEERYHIPSDDLYLVGSAEHALGSMFMDEILEEDMLPIRLIGYSTSFRREAGSYGKDVKGILRLHQFDKLEFESFTVGESSFDEHLFFIAMQEHLMQALDIPYRLVQSCTGDMEDPNARKVDVEAWMPGQNTYRETHSADYMTDFQARRLKTRVKRKSGDIELVHTNDATAIALGRTLIAIMENYQQKDGSIAIPRVLKKYLSFKKIPTRSKK